MAIKPANYLSSFIIKQKWMVIVVSISLVVGSGILWVILLYFGCVIMFEDCLAEHAEIGIMSFFAGALFSFFVPIVIVHQDYNECKYVPYAIFIYFAVAMVCFCLIHKCVKKHTVLLQLISITMATISLVVATYKDFDKEVNSNIPTKKVIYMYENYESVKDYPIA